MSKLVDVEAVEAVIGKKTDSGKVFVGWRQWVQNTSGAWFDAETVADAREVVRTVRLFNQECPDVYGALIEWAKESRFNAYEANLLAGVIWAEMEK